jgi:hypothetical protein
MQGTHQTTIPSLLGRHPEAAPRETDIRAETARVASVTIPLTGAVAGFARAELFGSLDDEDRGGVVIRLTIEDPECALVPTCRDVAGGSELHLAGDAEADAMLRAIAGVLAARKR